MQAAMHVSTSCNAQTRQLSYIAFMNSCSCSSCSADVLQVNSINLGPCFAESLVSHHHYYAHRACKLDSKAEQACSSSLSLDHLPHLHGGEQHLQSVCGHPSGQPAPSAQGKLACLLYVCYPVKLHLKLWPCIMGHTQSNIHAASLCMNMPYCNVHTFSPFVL